MLLECRLNGFTKQHGLHLYSPLGLLEVFISYQAAAGRVREIVDLFRGDESQQFSEDLVTLFPNPDSSAKNKHPTSGQEGYHHYTEAAGFRGTPHSVFSGGA